MLIIAERGDGVYLLAESVDPLAPARVLDVGTGQYWRPLPAASIVARGYWRPVVPPEPAGDLLKMVRHNYGV